MWHPRTWRAVFSWHSRCRKSATTCFFISAADGLNTRPTLELVRERYGFLPEIRRPELYERLPTASVLDGSRAREVLGFEPTRDWRQMLAAPPASAAEA